MKPRRKQHQSHNNKAGHDTYRVKETLIPSIILENEIVGSVEGKICNVNGLLYTYYDSILYKYTHTATTTQNIQYFLSIFILLTLKPLFIAIMVN